MWTRFNWFLKILKKVLKTFSLQISDEANPNQTDSTDCYLAATASKLPTKHTHTHTHKHTRTHAHTHTHSHIHRVTINSYINSIIYDHHNITLLVNIVISPFSLPYCTQQAWTFYDNYKNIRWWWWWWDNGKNCKDDNDDKDDEDDKEDEGDEDDKDDDDDGDDEGEEDNEDDEPDNVEVRR